MQILLAKKAGFCSGVRRAFQITEEASRDDGRWCTLGQLVHNDEVVRHFRGMGIEPVNSIEDINCGGVINSNSWSITRGNTSSSRKRLSNSGCHLSSG